MIKKEDVKSLAKSFRYARRGLAYCIQNERNMRIHLSAVVLDSFFSYFYGLEKLEYIILLLCFGFVICAEVFNTSIEALVNLESPSYHHLARIAKDVAAGAVFIAAATALAVGAFLFCLHPSRLLDTLYVIFINPFAGAIFLILIMLSVLFIFNGPKLYRDKSSSSN